MVVPFAPTPEPHTRLVVEWWDGAYYEVAVESTMVRPGEIDAFLAAELGRVRDDVVRGEHRGGG